MGKTHRGKGLKDQARGGRGECPVCHRTAVKVVYEIQVKDATVKVCKICKATASRAKTEKPAAEPAAAPTA